MDAISSNIPSVQMQGDKESNNHSKMESMAKAMGVPDEIIAKGKSAVKDWMKENGKMPGFMNKDSANKTDKNSDKLKELLNASGISHENFVKAIEEGSEATKKLFDENDFSLNMMA